jgi:UDP-MurNAc hydroxylase
MRVLFLGQAGLFIETKYGSILCDPWFTPAYFASWFPFPSNEHIDPAALAYPDYLYISHSHHDHFDPQWLKDNVSRDATVLLPDFPIPLLEGALRDCGFTRFIRSKNGQWVRLNDGLTIAIIAQIAPSDGPLGDSGLIVDDGEARIFDQNDSRPLDMDLLAALGPYDAHFLQYSGALWYPMVYQFPPKMMEALGRKKRENEMARALRYTQQVNATFVIPHAGPPCFLDDGLFELNDFDGNPANTFPDQMVWLEYLEQHGHTGGRLLIPGSIAEISRTSCDVTHPVAEDDLRRIFTEKRAYLEAYKARQQRRIDAIKASWPRGQVDVLASIKEWFEPLMAVADFTAVAINGLVVIDTQPFGLVLDWHQRSVYAWDGRDDWDYYLKLDRALLEYCIIHHIEDWINEIFLSCRFEARRKGAYNEYVYNWFKCLSTERLEYAEGFYAEQSTVDQFFEAEGYRIQRRCPHLKSDLTRFSTIEGGILTCTLHGWQFELATGRCLTSDDRRLYTVPLASEAIEVAMNDSSAPTPLTDTAAYPPKLTSMQMRCAHCWYVPAKWPEDGKASHAGRATEAAAKSPPAE